MRSRTLQFTSSLLTVLLGVGLGLPAGAQSPPVQTQYAQHRFKRLEVMVPMRDGVKLQTVIFTPDHAGPLPVLLMRTPYGVTDDEKELESGRFDDLIADGYIFVVQNIRGRFKSEGSFVMQRPVRNRQDPKSVDEATDAYDTVDWLIKNVPGNNGRAGIYGISYGGWLVTQALLEPHPALKAASEQASPDDMFINDDFHHNGAFRLSYGFEYAALLESSKDENTHFEFDQYDTYGWYLSLGALGNANARYFHGKLPTWNEFVEHPNHDSWKQNAVTSYLKHTTVPNLNVAGWYDQEDFVGPTRIYDALEKTDTDHLNYFVAGPWDHGGWMRESGRKLGDIDWGSDTARDYRANILAPWFAHWLHDKPLHQPEAVSFQTGSNRWKSYEQWPLRDGVKQRRLYLRAGGRLSFDAPTETAAFDAYVSDPANPVPYRQRPVTPTYPGPAWKSWQVQDQRFVDNRPDVLTWKTDPLQEDITVTGQILADLFASTSGSDGDWVVKLIDVFPEDYQKISDEDAERGAGPVLNGYELMVTGDIMRARYRNSLDKPEAVKPNQVTEYKIDLHPADHVFLKGHRIMVQVQSTWFPVYDRNPQTFVPNIFTAKDSDYRQATQKVWRSRSGASAIVLPVVGK